jgi:hypothetical protein
MELLCFRPQVKPFGVCPHQCAHVFPVLMGSSSYCVVCNTAVSSAILETPEDDLC